MISSRAPITMKPKGSYKGKRYYSPAAEIPTTLLKFMGWIDGDVHFRHDKNGNFVILRHILKDSNGIEPGTSSNEHIDQILDSAEKITRRNLTEGEFLMLSRVKLTGKNKRQMGNIWKIYEHWLWFNEQLLIRRWKRAQAGNKQIIDSINPEIDKLLKERMKLIFRFPSLEELNNFRNFIKEHPKIVKEFDELDKQIREYSSVYKGTKPKEESEAHSDSPKNTALRKEDAEQLEEIRKKKTETEEM